MQLRVKTTTGLVGIEVSEDGTVLDLKSALAERLGGSDPGLLRLIFKGRVLKDSSMLSEYGVVNESQIHAVQAGASSGGSASLQQGAVPSPGALARTWRTRQVLDAHPELRHALADPETLRQSLAVLQNPELLREQMRSTDRALSNLEAHPEGFNALRRMYETVQEPLMAAAVPPPPPSADNPFASLFAPPPSTTPNTAPLPNPWAPNAGAAPAAMAAAPSPAGAPAGLEAALAAALAGGAGQGGQHGAPNNAALMEALFPGMGAAGAAGAAGVPPPEMLAMLQNPGMARALANPSSLQAMMQIQQAMATLQANGMPMPPGMMGAGWTPPGPQPDPAVAFASQLQQLRDMGFSSDTDNLRALQATADDYDLARAVCGCAVTKKYGNERGRA